MSSSGDELADLLLAELEDQEAEISAAAPVGPPSKRAKTADSRGGACPPHPGFMGGICIRCGALKPKPENGAGDAPPADAPRSTLALKYIHHGLEVSLDEVQRLQASTIQAALSSRRLLLILDLDHTLLHSTRFADLKPEQEASLRARLPEHPPQRSQQSQQQPPTETTSPTPTTRAPAPPPLLYRLPHMGLWTKLRPGVREFLQSARELFDLHVYTMGDQDYAAGMAAILDPDGRLFGGRVASSSDAGPSGVKDVDVLLGAEELVLILDDTVGVWPRHRDNLVQIERYIYFPACAARFGRGGQSLFERSQDEDPERGALGTSLRIMADVHRRFFEEADRRTSDAEGGEELPDVRAHLRTVRGAVLAGCCILFSRIISKDADPTANPLWQLATQMGARCVRETCDEVTHVVARDRTDKTKWAMAAGKHTVNPEWVLCSAFTWERAEEERFPIASQKNGAAPPPVASEAADAAAALQAAGGGGAA